MKENTGHLFLSQYYGPLQSTSSRPFFMKGFLPDLSGTIPLWGPGFLPLLFLGIWIEKGIGMIVPGLIPSPMGEVIDYLPTWVEIWITLGILVLGIFVVTLLIRPALVIEERFDLEVRPR